MSANHRGRLPWCWYPFDMSEEAGREILVAIVIIGLVVMFYLGYLTAYRIHHKPRHRWAPPADHETPIAPVLTPPPQPKPSRDATPAPLPVDLDECGVCYRRLRCDRQVSSCPFIEVKVT